MGQAKTSYTELSTLAACEEKWRRQYAGQERVKSPPSWQMATGTLFHAGTAAFWVEGETDPGLREAGEKMLTEWPALPVFTEAYELAEWLLGRYAETYREMVRNVETVAVEKRLQAKVPGSPFSIYGYVDTMLKINGQLWLREAKTMSDWSRMDLVTVDPQQTLYFWLAKVNGLEPAGIMFDAARTYRWALEKPTQATLIAEAIADSDASGLDLPWDIDTPWVAQNPDIAALTPAKRRLEWARAAVEAHPGVEKHLPHESFQIAWLDRTDDQIAEALRWARGIMRRRTALKHGAYASRNIGPFCKTCFFKDDCFEDFAFPQQEFIMELD